MTSMVVPILTGLLTLIGVCVTAWSGARQTRDTVSNQLMTAQAVRLQAGAACRRGPAAQ